MHLSTHFCGDADFGHWMYDNRHRSIYLRSPRSGTASTIETNSLFFPQKAIKCLPMSLRNQKSSPKIDQFQSGKSFASVHFVFGSPVREPPSWENYAKAESLA